METRVVHCQHSDYDIYIGRGACPKTGELRSFGNPFVLGQDGDRETVCIKFKAWLIAGKTFGCQRAVPSKRKWILEHLEELRGKVIACWCKPNNDCHGDVYLELLEDKDTVVNLIGV
jgi:Domain of unknown function (DUF4326)